MANAGLNQAGVLLVVRLSEDVDLQAIEGLVRALTSEPILRIRVTDKNVVEVMTGVIRGPLDGQGSYYDFAKRNGAWSQINAGTHKVWAS